MSSFPWETIKANTIRVLYSELVGSTKHMPSNKENLIEFMKDVGKNGLESAVEKLASAASEQSDSPSTRGTKRKRESASTRSTRSKDVTTTNTRSKRARIPSSRAIEADAAAKASSAKASARRKKRAKPNSKKDTSPKKFDGVLVPKVARTKKGELDEEEVDGEVDGEPAADARIDGETVSAVNGPDAGTEPVTATPIAEGSDKENQPQNENEREHEHEHEHEDQDADGELDVDAEGEGEESHANDLLANSLVEEELLA